MIETGDKRLDAMIVTASATAEQLTKESGGEEMLRDVLVAAIWFRVAEYLDNDVSRKIYLEKIDSLYEILLGKGMSESKIAEMVRKITTIIKR